MPSTQWTQQQQHLYITRYKWGKQRQSNKPSSHPFTIVFTKLADSTDFNVHITTVTTNKKRMKKTAFLLFHKTVATIFLHRNVCVFPPCTQVISEIHFISRLSLFYILRPIFSSTTRLFPVSVAVVVVVAFFSLDFVCVCDNISFYCLARISSEK